MTYPLSRRSLLAGGVLIAGAETARAQAPTSSGPIDHTAPLVYPFTVPPLPYAYEANEPAIDSLTMHLHHDKHHAAYVKNLNEAVKDHPDVAAKPLHEMLADLPALPESIRTTVRNNAGGHANHTMFWQVMGGPGGEPTGEVVRAVNRDFGSYATLKTAFDAAATKVFGSGWAMVLVDRNGVLSLVSRPNQDSPLMDGRQVLFGNDVWEHSYYLKYQNRRPEYLEAWWSVVDWRRVEERYAHARAGLLLI